MSSQEILTGLKLRPWFYPWSLLCRFFPPGSIIYRPEPPVAKVRVLAARLPGKEGGWSFCLVNRNKRPCKAALSVRGDTPGTAALKRYVYSPGSAKADAAGFPVPVAVEQCDLRKGLAVECPADGVVIMTTAE